MGKFIVLVVFLTATGDFSVAEDKNGVAPTSISRPSGPGSLEGLGDAFQPALNTGTARHRIRFDLPTGIAGFTPELALQYDSGQGFSPAGIGWALDLPSVRRQVDKGLPRYVDQVAGGQLPDRFIGISGEELVPLRNGYFLPKVEGTFVRYRRIGDHWEAHTRNGIKMEFGASPDARVSDLSGTRIFRWCLERQIDTHGNVIRFHYVRPSEEDREVYLSEIRYGPGAEPWEHFYVVRLSYEVRPDPQTDYRSGFKVRSSRRLIQVDVLYDEALIRRYVLGYDTHPHWSLLSSLTQLGDDGVSPLPATTFRYATLAPEDKPSTISATGRVIGAINEPSVVMDNAKVELLDINADALPDVVMTDAGHLAYLNRGTRVQSDGTRAIAWEGPVAIAAQEPRAFGFELSEGNVHLADMTGDAVADLVVAAKSSVEYFANTGRLEWDVGRPMSVAQSPPPAPFGPGGDSVLTADLDFDKRIDVIRSDAGAYSVWLNLDGGAFGDETLTAGAFYNNAFVDFSDVGVQLADMNGDRLNDLVKVLTDRVVWFASMGFGEFDQPISIPIPDRALDDAPGGTLERATLSDVNGDGLADLVVERAKGADLWFWLNLGNESFAPLRIVTDLPATSNAVTRFADLNGNGTTDIIYADSTAPGSRLVAVDLGELIAGTAFRNSLLGIDNGFGRRISIDYRSSTDFLVEARIAGNPWSTALPVPVPVVSRVWTSIGLNLDGYPDEGADGDRYVTDYVYRDGYYDPWEKQFRGFAFVKQIDRGDERFGGSAAPTLVTRYGFHTGAPDGLDNNGDAQLDEQHPWNGGEEEPLKGLELWREISSLPDDPAHDGAFADAVVVFSREEQLWRVRDAATATSGSLPALLGDDFQADDVYGRSVRLPVNLGIHRTLIERQVDPSSHRRLEKHLDLDPVGNVRFVWDRGDVANPDDDLYTGNEYAMNEGGWIVDRVSRTFQRADASDGPFVSENRNYYDGPVFQGLPLGQIGDRALLHRSEALLSGGTVPPLPGRSILRGDPRDPDGRVDLLRREFDAFGNAVVVLDANAVLAADGRPDGGGHERRIEYDPSLHRFPVRETLMVGIDRAPLIVSAAYHFGFGKLISYTDFNERTTRFTYDTLGRLTQESLPGDDPHSPTRTHAYQLGDPISRLTTVAHDNEAGSPDVETSRFFDGMGRLLGTFEHGGPVMFGVTGYDPRGQPSTVFQPYGGQPLDPNGDWSLPGEKAPATVTIRDATGRLLETISPPDADGIRAISRHVYLPLRVVDFDGEDTRAGGPHFNTPQTRVFDGLDRLVELRVVETLSIADAGQFTTRYRYALPNLLSEIEDAGGNVRWMRYDGLGRRIAANDCNRGATTYTFDRGGNLIDTLDARDQRIVYRYDGVNRMVQEDYLDDGTALSAGRTPDVRYHYDEPSPAHPTLPNTRGHLAWVEDVTGAEFRGFDARDHLETRIKAVARSNGALDEYATSTLFDPLGRAYQITYLDGGVVRVEHDARGLLSAVSDFMDALAYEPSGRKRGCEFANGASTLYAYDPRLRLRTIRSDSGNDLLQNLSYVYDQTDNLLRVDDARLLPPHDPRNQTGVFGYDNSYRLFRADILACGLIEYDYDRLGNMVKQVSPDVDDPNIAFGLMISGGTGGTSGRVGRNPGDPPGPHALTTVNDGVLPWTLDYDDNGNVIRCDAALYEFDFKDRLGAVQADGRHVRYQYDWADRRVIKRVDDDQTTYIDERNEIRDGELVKYVFADRTRIAQVKGPLPVPSTIAQRLSLARGWNLVSFQVTPSSTDPATILVRLHGKLTAVYGFESGGYVEYRPQGTANTLTSLRANCGYWIHLAEPAELLITGTLQENSLLPVTETSDLVGSPGLAYRSAAELAATLPGIRAILAYDGDRLGWRVFDTTSPDFLQSLTHVEPGRGYWVIRHDSAAVSLTPPAMPVQEAASILYFHPDHLGSTNVLTDAAGQVVSEIVYHPFGSPRYRHEAPKAGIDPHYLFTDCEQDEESGLQHLEKRYYLSSVGRLLSYDNWASDVNLTGPYAYARNNPLRYVDPRGMDPTESSDDESESSPAKEPVGEVAKGVVESVPGVIQETNQKAGGIAVSQAGALSDPDPDKRTAAAEKFAGDVGSAAGEIGAEKGWDVIDKNTEWEFKVPLIAGFAGLAIGLAFDDTDLPTPIPAITFGVGGGTVTLSPSVDLSPITTEGEEEQYVYAPGVGMGLGYGTGTFTQSISGSITPGPEGIASASGSVGLGVNAGPISFGASASGTLDKNYTVSGSLTIKAP